MVLGTNDADTTQELRLDSIRKGDLKFVHVLTDREISVVETEDDPLSEFYGLPRFWEIRSARGITAKLHRSRVIIFTGQEAIERKTGEWLGESRLQRLYDAILHAATADAALAAMTLEGKVDVIKVEGLTSNVLDPIFRQKIIQRFAMANLGKSVNNALLLDAAEDWDQKTVSMAGWPEVLSKFLEICAGASGIPVSRLLGKAPTGLNSNADSDIRAYYDKIAAQQENDLRPALEVLDEALIRSALGARPAKLFYNWAPLWQMDEAEKATIALQKAQAIEIYAQGSFMPPSALRQSVQNMLIEDGLLPGLEDAIEKAGAEDPAPLISKASTPATSANATQGRKTAVTQ
ncbi:putative cytosolic protein [Roseomonas mucosa]|nr:putative cytosolic protein [Roseomonas mucosa]